MPPRFFGQRPRKPGVAYLFKWYRVSYRCSFTYVDTLSCMSAAVSSRLRAPEKYAEHSSLTVSRMTSSSSIERFTEPISSAQGLRLRLRHGVDVHTEAVVLTPPCDTSTCSPVSGSVTYSASIASASNIP